jgi:phage host-nuclease inhibitor protein Gam
MSKKIQGKAAQRVVVPRNRAEAEYWIRQIGEHRREAVRIETEMNDEIALIKARHEEQARPYRDDIEALLEGLQAWAVANRDDLTGGGKRQSAELATGLVLWRVLPPKVTIRKAEMVIEALKKLGLTRFIRVREELNKEAMLDDQEAARLVPGVTIGSAGETFSVEPFETELEAAKV